MTDDNDVLRKIQGLLAKAERTDNDNEADAFFAKANELMQKYAIDEARVRTAAGQKATNKIVCVEWMFASNDYNAKGRRNILAVAAQANRAVVFLKSRYYGQYMARAGKGNATAQWCEIWGRPEDVEYVKLFYTSLFAQGVKSGRRQAKARGLKVSGANSGAYAFVTSYLVGYAGTASQRLTRYMNLPDPSGVALVKQITSEVWEAIYEKYPYMRPNPNAEVAPRKKSYYKPKGRRMSWDGYMSGAADAENADLGAPGRVQLED